MTTAAPALQIEDRLAQLFHHLGISRAHVGGGYAADAVSLVRASPESIASMTLVCPFRLPTEPFRPFAARVMFIHGDRGPGAGSAARIRTALPQAHLLTLRDYVDAAWSDALAERRAEIEPALLPVLAEQYTTIVLGGAFVGIIPSLEARMQGGYRTVVRSVVDAADLQPG